MSNNLKIRSPWTQLAIFLGLLGGALILYSFVASAIVLAKTGIQGKHTAADLMSDPRLLGTLKWVQALSSVMVFGIPALFYARQTFRDRPLYHLGLRPAEKYSFYMLGIILLLAAFPLEGWLGIINKQLPLPAWMINLEKDNDTQIAVFLKAATSWDVVINLLVVAVLPGIFEELCFRGALQRILIHCFRSPWTGIIVGAAFFSAFHMQFQGFLPRMLLGILLGLTYWYSGSLWTSILAHIFFNGIQVVAATYSPAFVKENPSIPLYTALLSLVIVVGLLAWMRRQSGITYEQVYTTNPTGEHNDFMSNRF